jgi:hypothetical protein
MMQVVLSAIQFSRHLFTLLVLIFQSLNLIELTPAEPTQ